MEKINIINKLDTNPKKSPWRKRSRTNYIAVHHSEVDGQGPFNFNDYHINHHGWYKVSYHYVIEPRGFVYQCNEEDDYTYHVGRSNKDTIGICVAGDLDKHPMDQWQQNALVELLVELALKYDLHYNDIKGHREFPGYSGKKTCPGEKTDMGCLRSMVAQEMVKALDSKIWILEHKVKRLEEEDEKARLRPTQKNVGKGKTSRRTSKRKRSVGDF